MKTEIEQIGNNVYNTVDSGDIGRWDATIKKMPKLYGVILDADRRNGFTGLLERVYKRDIFTLKEFLDFDEDEFRLEPSCFDFILSFEVLEHLMNPKHYLKNLHWGLGMNGTLILTTPVAYYPPKLMWLKKHFHEFDEERLRELLKQSGFRVKRIERFGKSLRYGGGILPLFRKLFGWYWYVEAKK